MGGHNILEAAAQRRAVIYGPYMHNFREIEANFRQAGVGIMVADEEELQRVVADCWDHPEQWRELGEKAYQLLQKHKGATKATLAQVPAGGHKDET